MVFLKANDCCMEEKLECGYFLILDLVKLKISKSLNLFAIK